MSETLLFSVTKDDLEWSYFRVGGKGGQHRDKTNTGVRVFHPPSGAMATASDHRLQGLNKIAAFSKLANSAKMRVWINKEILVRTGVKKKILENVEKSLKPENIKIEIKDEKGRWVEVDVDEILS